jgi:hypothetical protein
MIVKDKELFDLVFNNPKSVYLSAENMAYHYTAKYQTEFLKKITIPKVSTQREAIDTERKFGNDYVTISGAMPLEPLMGCGFLGMPIVERHGRKGIIIENKWLEKHKTNY